MLARVAFQQYPDTTRIDILIELGLGDHHGKTALAWMFDNIDRKYQVIEDGQPKQVRSFGQSRPLKLAGQEKPRTAYRFAMPDQQIAAQQLGVASVSTWIRFDGRAMTWLFSTVRIGSDICGVAVNIDAGASGPVVLGVTGRKEAEMTAIIAAETARQVLEGDLPAGVASSDVVIDFAQVLAALQKAQPEMLAQV